jgi:chaperonin cofactor prefoldin
LKSKDLREEDIGKKGKKHHHAKKMTQAELLSKLEEDINGLLGRIETLEGEKEDLKKRVDGLEERLEKTVKERD